MMLIPFNKLVLSDSNVRKTHNSDADEQLSLDIEAHGLLQNLVVTKAKKRGFYAVIAGGRRLRGIGMIVDRGAWEPTVEIECKLLEGSEESASEVSLAENFQRLAMTPAEECRAFQHFIKEGDDTAAVAKRFGQTQRFVDGRLRLAALAEPIFDALASGKITLELAKAYASTDQHDVQLRVFEQLRHSYSQTPDNIRRTIAGQAVAGTDPLALLIGEGAYTAAGGRIERDLFSDVAADSWLDVEIVQRLVGEKMEAEAARLMADLGIGCVWPVASTYSYNVKTELKLNAVRLPPAPISEEAALRIDQIHERMEVLVELIDDETAEDSEARDAEVLAAEKEYEGLETELSELSNPVRVLPEEWKGEVGRFLILSKQGEMVLEPDYYSEKVLRLETDDSGAITGGSFSEPAPRGGDKTPESAEAAAPDGKKISQSLFDQLAVQRRNILAASLLGDPGLALDFAIFSLAASEYASDKGTSISAGRPQDPARGDIPQGTAETMLAEARDALDASWREPKSVVDRFIAFRALDDDAKAAWLAYTVATSLEAKKGYGSAYHPVHALLGTLLEIDVPALWRPTSENFFDRISKTQCLAALTDVGGAELAARYAASKKPDLSAACSKLFAGESIVEPEVRDRAVEWVPPAMRFDLAAPEVPADVDDADDADGEEGGATDDLGADALDGPHDDDAIDGHDGNGGADNDDDDGAGVANDQIADEEAAMMG
ncbi:ParB/RepB/Spo0J family partition protein [Croceibacterium mercuriale]|uniref:ParB/RepB/Spo0J family partition protein n=1 Tax=Croceibacterium mercuriale TaxID=1572751 RepID=UPI000689F5D5|nr:ParB/RepB/Spo0J family partition protein [Croceibacterium mercuriale]